MNGTAGEPLSDDAGRSAVRRLLDHPADPGAFAARIRTLRQGRDILAWARRYCCVSDELDALALRRILEASDALTVDDLAGWANSSSHDRRYPWAIVTAALLARRPGLLAKLTRNPLRFADMGDHFSRLVCAVSPRPVATSVPQSVVIAHMQLVTASVLLEAGHVPEYEALSARHSAFNRRTRRLASVDGYRALDRTWGSAIGHVVILAHLLAAQKLGLVADRWSCLKKDTVPNAYLFNLMSRAAGNLKFTQQDGLFFEAHASGLSEVADGRALDWFELCGLVAGAVDPARGALLSIPSEDRPALAEFLAAVGHPGGGRYVTVHCREDGFKRPGRHRARNARIQNYLPALAALVDRGYTVVRLGDPSMSRLPERRGFVDYAHSPLKSPQLDVLLVAEADFHIGTSSGLSVVPLLFGTPCLFLDWYPTTLLPWGPRTWTVLKTLADTVTGERVADPEVIRRAGKVPDTDVLAELGYSLLDQSPAEIAAAVPAYLDYLGRDAGVPTGAPAVTAPVFRFDADGRLVRLAPRRG